MRAGLHLAAIALAGVVSTAPDLAPGHSIQVARVFTADGRLTEERGWRGGREEGVHRGWWPGGGPRFEYRYHEGRLRGVSREWFESGALWREQRYDAGHEAGLQRMYWEDGRVRASYEVLDGRRYGLLGAKGCVTRDSTTTGTAQ